MTSLGAGPSSGGRNPQPSSTLWLILATARELRGTAVAGSARSLDRCQIPVGRPAENQQTMSRFDVPKRSFEFIAS